MKRKFWRPAIAALALAASMMTVHAEEYTGSDGWAATFTGEGIESNFSSRQIADAVSELQPGDSVTINVDVANTDSRTANFYLSNQVLSSLEDSNNAAQGGAYGYRLAYMGPTGSETVLYNSEAVGGDATTMGKEGLHKATVGMEEFLYLDALKSGEKGNITLRVSLDGETQGNGYQNTFANLQLNFAVEPVDENARRNDGGGNGDNGGNGGNGGNRQNGQNAGNGQDGTGGQSGGAGTSMFTQDRVYTGDANRILAWSMAALLSGLGLLIFGVVSHTRKQRRKRV